VEEGSRKFLSGCKIDGISRMAQPHEWVRLITIFMRPFYCYLSWASRMNFRILHPVSLCFILILYTHLLYCDVSYHAALLHEHRGLHLSCCQWLLIQYVRICPTWLEATPSNWKVRPHQAAYCEASMECGILCHLNTAKTTYSSYFWGEGEITWVLFAIWLKKFQMFSLDLLKH
jgi:hypothetical protein